MTLTELRAETSLVFSPHWPNPICPKGGQHDFVVYMPGWICDSCGAIIQRDEAVALLGWWQRIHLQVVESWPNN